MMSCRCNEHQARQHSGSQTYSLLTHNRLCSFAPISAAFQRSRPSYENLTLRTSFPECPAGAQLRSFGSMFAGTLHQYQPMQSLRTRLSGFKALPSLVTRLSGARGTYHGVFASAAMTVPEAQDTPKGGLRSLEVKTQPSTCSKATQCPA